MAVSLLYQKIIQGGFLYFGNALGLTKGVGAIVPGTIATQGAFMTVDTTTVAPGGWPAGTTLNWMDANSRVYVDIPNGTTIDEAFLIWGGNTGGTIGAIARTTPVYLITPDNVKHIITPVTTLNGAGFYSCSANVTSIVKGFGSGDFICGSIPANITAAATGAEGGGWVLALAIQSQSGAYNYATLTISNDNYGQIGTSIPIITPSTGTVTANLMTAVIHAACDKGDALILQDTRPFSAPNREAPNFFNSIISNNSGDGLPYTNATFGSNNNDPSTRSNTLNARQGLDLAIYPSKGDIPANSSSYYLDGYNGGISFSPTDGNTNYIAYGAAVNPSNATTTLKKTVDKPFANYGDTVIYTMNVVLEGSGSIFNFKIFDTIPDNTSFVPGSIFVNGVNKPLDNLALGITLASSVNLPYSGTVTYSAIINSSGSFNNIQNSCYVVFRNTISNGTVFTNTIVSEYAVTTIIKTANISVNKSVNKNYTKIGEILTYTIVLNNSGILNATTATFIDTLPTDITLIPNTLKVDGVLNNQTSNPLNIDLSPFNSMEVKTITFDVQIVNTIPSINPIINKSFVNYNYIDDSGVAINMDTISNSVVTTVAYASLVSNKIVDKNYAEVLDVITYTIPIHYNVGNMSAYNIKFIDTLPSEVTLNSIMVDGVTVVGSLSSPGITIPTIPAGGVSTVSFKITVNTVPAINPIINSGFIKYSYTEDPLQLPINSELNTNIVQTTIINSKFDVRKIVDKNFSTVNDTLTYTIVIKNLGNIEGQNLNFTDTIASSLTYIPGTLKLNGVLIGGTPNNISIGNILTGESVTIQYMARVN